LSNPSIDAQGSFDVPEGFFALRKSQQTFEIATAWPHRWRMMSRSQKVIGRTTVR
jgi:hypothetical protein